MRHRYAPLWALTLVGALVAAGCTANDELPGGTRLDTASSVAEAQARVAFPVLVLPDDGSSGSKPPAVRIIDGPDGTRGILLTYRLDAGQASIGQSTAPADYAASFPTEVPAEAAGDQAAAAERIAQAAATAPSGIAIGIQVRSHPGLLLGGSYKTMLQWVEDGVGVTLDCSCPAPEALQIAGWLRPFAEAAP